MCDELWWLCCGVPLLCCSFGWGGGFAFWWDMLMWYCLFVRWVFGWKVGYVCVVSGIGS